MAVEHVDSWRLLCDDCGEEFENVAGWTIFADQSYALDDARDCDWCVRPDMALCLACREEDARLYG